MKSCSTSGIGQKQVINVCDGAVLGYVTDIEFDVCDGRVTAIVVGECGALGICRGETVRVPWCNIKCIGEDTILVDIVIADCKCSPEGDKKKKKIGKIL